MRMKNLLNLLITVACFACTPNSKSENSSWLKLIELDFSEPKSLIYNIDSRIISKAQNLKISGTMIVSIKGGGLADVIINYDTIISESSMGSISLGTQKIIMTDMNDQIQFASGTQYLEMYPKLTFPIPSHENGNISSEVDFLVAVNQRDTRKRDPNSQTTMGGILKLYFPDNQNIEADSILIYNGQFEALKEASEELQQKAELRGQAEYQFNVSEKRFEQMSIRMNLFLEMPRTTYLTNVLTTYKYIKTE